MNFSMGGRNSNAQKKKKEAKLKMVQLVEKSKKQATKKAQAKQAGKEVGKQTSGIDQGSDKGMQSPSPETEEEDTE